MAIIFTPGASSETSVKSAGTPLFTNGASAGMWLGNIFNKATDKTEDLYAATGDNQETPDWLTSLLTTEIQQLNKNMIYNTEEARKTREFNATEAQKLRDWQERLSNTSYQRAMSDMVKAGLNPILAFQQGGATVPSGSSASANNASMSTKGGMSFGDLAELLGILVKLVPALGAMLAAL